MDLSRINTLTELKELIELLETHGITEFECEFEGRKLRIGKGGGQAFGAMPSLIMPGIAGAPPPLAAPAAAPGAPAAEASPEAALPPGVKVVNSPMVGSFFRAPSPEADPFVEVGDKVDQGAVLCIIEAMKVMNEVPSEISGVVKAVLIENGDSVEFGQPLFHIQVD